MKATDIFDEPGTDQRSPFAGAGEEEFAEDVEIALEQLTVVRDVYDQQILRELAALLPFDVARDNKAILLERQRDGSFFVGMCNHQNFVHIRNVARALHVQTSAIHPRLLTDRRHAVLLEEAYDHNVSHSDVRSTDSEDLHSDEQTLSWHNLEPDADIKLAAEVIHPEAETESGTGLRATAAQIIRTAIAKRVSDIHLVPQLESGYIKFRTDGVLYRKYENIPPARMENLANAFCDMAGVNGYDVMQRGVAREISMTVKTASGKRQRHTLRFQGRPGLHGRIIVIRIQNNEFRNFSEIGLEQAQITQLENALIFKSGLILVTGPTGSGKSNTLEAMLRKVEHLRDRRVNVIQIGNPIEFPNDDREQLPLRSDEDWAEAFNDSMRMDPDIFSPGEFRERTEANVVFQAAATGHLTLTTLHTNNVAQTFSRLDFVGIERDKQSALLKLIVSQELVPLLCPACKMPDPRGREIAERLIEVVFPNRRDLRDAIAQVETLPFFRRVGCARCNFRGVKLRTCIAEIMTITPDISRMLRQKVDGEDIVNHAIRHHGMITLAEAAARKLVHGLIAYDDIQHLLMSSHEAAPEEPTYSWQSEPSYPAQPSVDTEVIKDEEYIDAEIVYSTPEPTRAAA